MPDESRALLRAELAGAESKLTAFLADAGAGDVMELCQDGRPVARVVRVADQTRLRQPGRPGALKGQVYVAEDAASLPEEEARALGAID